MIGEGSSNSGNSRHVSEAIRRTKSDEGGLSVHVPHMRSSWKSSSISEEFTVNKLRFESVGFYGRDQEVATLTACLERLTDSDEGRRQLATISGYSGTGKTTLAKSLQAKVKGYHGLYLCGKFDQDLMHDEPYSGITLACQQLCGEIMALGQEENDDSTRASSASSLDAETKRSARHKEIRDKIIDQLGSELGLLTNVIPDLKEIVGADRLPTQESASLTGSLAEARNRFHYAFRRFFRVVTCYFAPVVLVLDDLQWADVSSLDLLRVLLTDIDIAHLMVVGCYRSNEVNDESHAVARMLQELRTTGESDGLDVTDLCIRNLRVVDVHQILMDLLATDDSRVGELARICHHKTDGNPFFLINYMSLLQRQDLLEYNVGLLKWIWHESEIEKQTVATENVVDLVKQKMTELPSEGSHFLSLAACLGSTFDKNTVTVVCEDFMMQTDSSNHSTATETWLALAVEEGFVESDGPCTYRWVHDKIQEAAFSLIPEDKLGALQSRIGEVLVHQLGAGELNSAIFVVVNLLNEGAVPTEPQGRARLSELNLQAAQRAVELAAFESASRYASKGIDLLTADRWSQHYDLSLQLYSTATEVDGLLGHCNKMQESCSEVLNQINCPLLDRLRVYNALLEYLGFQEDRPGEAIELCLDVLRQLGCKFPRNAVAIASSTILWLSRSKSIIMSRRMQEIVQSRIMTNPKHVACMKLLDRLATFCYVGSSSLFPLVVLRSLRLTLRHGLCESAPSAFALVGVLLITAFKDFQGGSDYGRLALSLLDKLQCKNVESRTLMITHYLVLPWTSPVHSMVNPLLKAYETGMQTGDTESALYAVANYFFISFQAGRVLQAVDKDCRVYLKQMHELKKYVRCILK